MKGFGLWIDAIETIETIKKDMDKIIKKTFFRVLLTLSLFYATSLGVFGATDDDIDAVFMTVALNNGQNESVMLSNSINYVGPRFLPTEKTITINGTCYNTEDVKAIRFEMQQVDAIQEVEPNSGHVIDNVIYNLNGQVVGKMKELPKGIYIVGGRKIVVR